MKDMVIKYVRILYFLQAQFKVNFFLQNICYTLDLFVIKMYCIKNSQSYDNKNKNSEKIFPSSFLSNLPILICSCSKNIFVKSIQYFLAIK